MGVRGDQARGDGGRGCQVEICLCVGGKRGGGRSSGKIESSVWVGWFGFIVNAVGTRRGREREKKPDKRETKNEK